MDEIKNYLIIGDLHSAALVGKNASIDWLCWPTFDSPSIFARILGENAGRFNVYTPGYTIFSEYEENTAILKFHFQKEEFRFSLHDFMLPQPVTECEEYLLLRRIKGLQGTDEVRFFFDPRPNFAQDEPTIKHEEGVLRLRLDEDVINLYLPPGTRVNKKDGLYELGVQISEGEEKALILEYNKHNVLHTYDAGELEEKTRGFWQKWVSTGNFINYCREELVRSAITLKLMQFYPTGAIIAAPTTSLPEEVAGSRNWDYRYVWIRDATFTLYSLYILGCREEAARFFKFIEDIMKKSESDQLHLLYDIWGNKVQPEKALEHLPGYKNSRPVRVGNSATEQFQTDVYGALIDAHYFASRRGLEKHLIKKEVILGLARKIQQLWRQDDHGIWEVRQDRRRYTYTKVMSWVGINRVLRLKDVLGLKKNEIVEFEKLESEIKGWIWQNCYDEERGVLKQHPETPGQDATNFLFILLQFLDKHDSRTRKIVENTCRELCHRDIFVYRYLTPDGLEGKEGAFLLCTFWLVSAFAVLEDIDRAIELFQKARERMDTSGPLPEEMDAGTAEYLGNYPQAFSHMGFIMAAYYLDRYSKKRKKGNVKGN